MKRLYFIASVFLLVSFFGCAKANEKVLLIFSYHPEYPWVIEEMRGAKDILNGKGIKIEKFYLDTKRKTSDEWKRKVAEDAVKKIEEFKPNLVIVFDDNACELVAKRYIGTNLPFVFSGMNGEPRDYGFPAKNITGVLERDHIKESIELLKRLVPDVEKAAIITDNSPTSQKFIARVKQSVLPVKICELCLTDDFHTWKAKVKELQSKVDALGLAGYQTIKKSKSGSKVSLPPEDVLRWTLNNSRLPEFAINEFTVKGGALCGVTLSGCEQGRAAAEIALTILAGANPADIPIQCPKKGIPMVNEKRAAELNIKILEDVLKETKIIY